LFKTEPSGAYSEWKAHAIGRSADTLREYLLKEYKENLGKDESVKLAIQTLMETVESAKNIDVTVMTNDKKILTLTEDEVK
jgi:20S proteasome subunit alpha 4